MPIPWPLPPPSIWNVLSAAAGTASASAAATDAVVAIRYLVMAAGRKASEVFVECLEAEGGRYVFGIPGEETLDLSESLAASSIQFVPVRHEQGGAYIADANGRLTGRAGV